MVQFHWPYADEDCIQGYRPTDGGGFELNDGVFHRFCEPARDDPERPHIFIIDEINRGNLSRTFGKLLVLTRIPVMEAVILDSPTIRRANDKRSLHQVKQTLHLIVIHSEPAAEIVELPMEDDTGPGRSRDER